jgi:hypothetical protein
MKTVKEKQVKSKQVKRNKTLIDLGIRTLKFIVFIAIITYIRFKVSTDGVAILKQLHSTFPNFNPESMLKQWMIITICVMAITIVFIFIMQGIEMVNNKWFNYVYFAILDAIFAYLFPHSLTALLGLN